MCDTELLHISLYTFACSLNIKKYKNVYISNQAQRCYFKLSCSSANALKLLLKRK